MVKGLTPEELVIGPDTEESGPGEIEIDEGHGENENVYFPQFCGDVIQVGRQKNSKSGVLLARGTQRQKEMEVTYMLSLWTQEYSKN